jgi:hypothetical protein
MRQSKFYWKSTASRGGGACFLLQKRAVSSFSLYDFKFFVTFYRFEIRAAPLQPVASVPF